MHHIWVKRSSAREIGPQTGHPPMPLRAEGAQGKEHEQLPLEGTSRLAYTGFSLDRSTPSLWRVTFDNPPINLIDPVMIVAAA